jgi:hypothetical protein
MVTKERYQKDKEKFRQQNKKAYNRNKDKIIKSVIKRNKNYYLTNPEYRQKEKVRLKTRLNNKKDYCLLCGSDVNLQFHHLNYTPDDFIILCKSCHTKQHLIQGNKSL